MPAPQILLLEDEGALARALTRRLGRQGYTVAACQTLAGARDSAVAQPPDLAMLDLRLPDGYGLDFLQWLRQRQASVPALIMTAFGELDDAIAAMRLGAVDFVKKPLDVDAVCATVGDALHKPAPARAQASRGDNGDNGDNGARADPAEPLIGDSPAMADLRGQIARIAELGAASAPPNVLLTGETGTGKDLAARMLHAASARAAADFVQVDCAALPGELVEAELFGHEKGAFTHAHRARRGLLAAAGQGTAFLNEIGELGLDLQAKLLTALETRSVREIGSDRAHAIDAWFVAATNRDLAEMMAAGTFRADLYYRLNVLTVSLPPLRARGDDVIALARHFIDQTAARYQRPAPRLAPQAAQALAAHHWPGNVRELRHVIERAVLVYAEDTLEAAHLRLPKAAAAIAHPRPAAADNATATLADSERELIAAALADSHGNISKTARRLGLSRGALRYRLDKYALDPGGRSDY